MKGAHSLLEGSDCFTIFLVACYFVAHLAPSVSLVVQLECRWLAQDSPRFPACFVFCWSASVTSSAYWVGIGKEGYTLTDPAFSGVL